MSITDEIISHSVTASDVMEYQGKGVVNFVMPYFWTSPRVFALPTDLPPYWSYQRDVILRNTILYEASYWGSAVGIAINKVAAQSFDIEGDVPRRIVDAQNLLVQWSGDSYVRGMSKLMLDYLTTDNGAFVEIVRQSSAAGSKIVGLVHLDSLRCQRTGDPETPILFRDLVGGLHELKDYQVMEFTDMPDPGYSWLGVGHCAAERAYDQIYKMAGVTRTVNEKITGSGAHQMAFISGMSNNQMSQVIATAQSEAQAKGLLYYQGTIIVAAQGDLPVDTKTLQLRGLPENFDQKETLDEALLSYANALGLVLTDLQPLSGQGLGTGKQAEVLEDKAQGRTIAAFRKMFTHAMNEWVMPDKTTFAFMERDLRDEQQRAAVEDTRETTRGKMIASGEVTAQEARQLAVDAGDLPKEFITVDTTGGQSLGDEEQGSEVEQEPTVNVVSPDAQTGLKPVPTGSAQQVTDAVESVKPTLNLNGAQVQAVMGIISSVTTGQIKRDAGSNMLQIMFNLSPQQADRMLGAIQDEVASPVAPVTKEASEIAALYALRDEIAATRKAMTHA
jgi:AraC-like DNA-binding protein